MDTPLLLVLDALARDMTTEETSVPVDFLNCALTVPLSKLWKGENIAPSVGNVLLEMGPSDPGAYAAFMAHRLPAVAFMLALVRNPSNFNFNDAEADAALDRVKLVRKIIKGIAAHPKVKYTSDASSESGQFILPYVVDRHNAEALSWDVELSPYIQTAERIQKESGGNPYASERLKNAAMVKHYARIHVTSSMALPSRALAEFLLFCMVNIQYHLPVVLGAKNVPRDRLDYIMPGKDMPGFSFDASPDAVTPMSPNARIAQAVVNAIARDPVNPARSVIVNLRE